MTIDQAMNPLDLSREKFREFLQKTPKDELNAIIAEINSANVESPTVDEYFSSFGNNGHGEKQILETLLVQLKGMAKYQIKHNGEKEGEFLLPEELNCYIQEAEHKLEMNKLIYK